MTLLILKLPAKIVCGYLDLPLTLLRLLIINPISFHFVWRALFIWKADYLNCSLTTESTCLEQPGADWHRLPEPRFVTAPANILIFKSPAGLLCPVVSYVLDRQAHCWSEWNNSHKVALGTILMTSDNWPGPCRCPHLPSLLHLKYRPHPHSGHPGLSRRT